MVSRARQIEIEVEIVEMLKDYGRAMYPMSIGKVAEALGIDIVPYSSLDERERRLALAASGDAFGIHNADFTIAKIVVNDMTGSYYNRSRFPGAHEVGHIHLEHTEDTPNRETEADYYAGYLLAPHPLILTIPKGGIDRRQVRHQPAVRRLRVRPGTKPAQRGRCLEAP